MPLILNLLSELEEVIAQAVRNADGPFVVAIDGRSAAGKSTLARALADRLDASVIEGDDFYAGGTKLRGDSPEARSAACIDSTQQRCILQALRSGREAAWRAFDWEAFDGRLRIEPTTLEPKPLVILEGVYAARPELNDMVDLRLLLEVPEEVRIARLLRREGRIGPWERQWHEAEDFYFHSIVPSDAFHVVFHCGKSDECAAL